MATTGQTGQDRKDLHSTVVCQKAVVLIKWSSFFTSCMEAYSCGQFSGHILQVQCKLLYMQNSTLQSACTELSGVHMQIYKYKMVVIVKDWLYNCVTILPTLFPRMQCL